MKKIMMAVASVAMAVVLTGCGGGSPEGVAEDFANALIKTDGDAAIELFNTLGDTEKEIKDQKEKLVKFGKDEIKDDKLEAEVTGYMIKVPEEGSGYVIINGTKVTGEEAEVSIQFIRGKDKQSTGMNVKLIKADGNWLVTKYRLLEGLDK